MPDIYKKISLFHDYIDDYDIDNMVEEIDGYILVQELDEHKKTFIYKVFDEYDNLIGKWDSPEDCLSMKLPDFKKSSVRRVFIEIIRQDKKNRKDYNQSFYKAIKKELDDEDDLFSYRYTAPKKSTGFLDKLNKSDTLVIHCQDHTTDMLSQIYEGKNWDVLRDGNIDKDELHQLLQSHDRIVCLGHGTPGGLLNKQGGGYVIGDEEAKYLKDKKLFIIWCNADRYASRHGLHGLITKNVPSEVWEAKAVGYDVTAPWMLENITYWSKCMADVVDIAWTNPALAAKKAREAYQKCKTDNLTDDQKGVIDYNTDAIQAM